jgi:hypothetical protein
MRIKKFTFITALLISLSSYNLFSQNNIHYYGWNTNYSHYASDIIEASNGDFVIIGDVNSSFPLIENYMFSKYLVRTNSFGNTIWTKYYANDIGGGNIIETSANDFVLFGGTSLGNWCGGTGGIFPLSDLQIQMYNSFGDTIYTNSYRVSCNDYIVDFVKNDDGSMTSLTYSEDVNFNDSILINELDISGTLTSLPIDLNWGGYQTKFEKINNGYLIASFDTLNKFDLNGNIIWQSILQAYHPKDFCQVNNDSFIFIYSPNFSDSISVVKTDSIGNINWTKSFPFNGVDVFMHSSGNYIITGTLDSNLFTIALNNNGDSIWSMTNILNKPAIAVKSIEIQNGNIVTLGAAGGHGFSSQYVVVMDTTSNLPTVNISIPPSTKRKVEKNNRCFGQRNQAQKVYSIILYL